MLLTHKNTSALMQKEKLQEREMTTNIAIKSGPPNKIHNRIDYRCTNSRSNYPQLVKTIEIITQAVYTPTWGNNRGSYPLSAKERDANTMNYDYKL